MRALPALCRVGCRTVPRGAPAAGPRHHRQHYEARATEPQQGRSLLSLSCAVCAKDAPVRVRCADVSARAFGSGRSQAGCEYGSEKSRLAVLIRKWEIPASRAPVASGRVAPRVAARGPFQSARARQERATCRNPSTLQAQSTLVCLRVHLSTLSYLPTRVPCTSSM